MNQNLWLETKDIFKRIIKLDPFVKKQNWSPQKMVMERIFPCYKKKWNCTVVRKWSFFRKGKYHKILALNIPEILVARLSKFQPEIWKEQDSRLRLRLLVQLLKFKFLIYQWCLCSSQQKKHFDKKGIHFKCSNLTFLCLCFTLYLNESMIL